MYKDKLPSAGLYYAQLVEREKVLKGLNSPKLGDSLLKTDGTPWMADLQKMAPRINWDDLTQTAALPLGSWIKTDPWDDKVHMLNAKRYAPMNARDKMPFEVTPIFYKLQRYEVASAQAPAAPAPGASAAPAAATPDPAAQQAPPPSAASQPPPPAAQPAASDTAPQQPAPAAPNPQ
jgi:hypothetical protein